MSNNFVASKDFLKVMLTAEERKECDAISISFLRNGGAFVVSEEWAYPDEICGNGCSVNIPARIWGIAMTWLNLKEPA